VIADQVAATHHRGQVALMMRQVGGKPLATDFHLFLVDGRDGSKL
jgi:uncharacterized damage-inducible protein DinB